MIICEINKNHLNVRTKELLTAGSQNVNTVEFRFNSAWDGLTKTATFKTSKKTISILLNTDITEIPWEVLADAGEILAVGVFGVSGETIVLPTVWGILGKVMDAAHLGDDEKEPTPDVYQKILDELNSIDKPTWADIANKPFSALGDGLEVDEDGVLSAKGGVELSQKAAVGEVLTVEEIDENGKPTKWKTAPAAAEQVQADWQENDETAASYVKNRPGGYTTNQTEKTTVTVPAHDGNLDDFTSFPPFEVGDTVNVTVNGTEYSLVATSMDSYAIAGVLSEDNPEEYLWSIDMLDPTPYFMNTTDADMTVEFVGEDPVKFDPKYIPNTEIDPTYIPDMYYTAIEPTIDGIYRGVELNMGKFTLVVGKRYYIVIDDIEYTAVATRDRTGYTEYSYVLASDGVFYLRIIESRWIDGQSQTGDLLATLFDSSIKNARITIFEEVTHQIDEKYIPEIPAEKITPSPTGGFELIDIVECSSNSSIWLYLSGSKYKKYRMLIGYGVVRTTTSPSRVKITGYKEPEDGGELRYNEYRTIGFNAYRIVNGATDNQKDWRFMIYRYWKYGTGATGENEREYYNQIMYYDGGGLNFYSLTDSPLEATKFYIYGMN